MHTCSKCGGEVPHRCNCPCERNGYQDPYSWTITRHGPTVFQWVLCKRNEQIDVGHSSSLTWAHEQVERRIDSDKRRDWTPSGPSPECLEALKDEEAQWFYRVQPYQWDAGGRNGTTFQVMKQRAICTARRESDANDIANGLNERRKLLKRINSLKDQVETEQRIRMLRLRQ